MVVFVDLCRMLSFGFQPDTNHIPKEYVLNRFFEYFVKYLHRDAYGLLSVSG